MLLILIPSLWIAVAAFFMLLCSAAARGDRALSTPEPGTLAPNFPGLVLFEQRSELASYEERRSRARVHSTGAARTRRARCIAG